jgi:putative ABC transport system permease protein
MALGGSRRDVMQLVIGQGMTVVMAGTVAGLAIAFASTRLMSSLLFNVGATDPAAYVGAAFILLSIAMLACAVPAFRAIRLQPAVVLRNE